MDSNQTTVLDQDRPRQDGGAKYAMTFGLPSADGRVRIGDDYEIFPDRPRPEFASFGTEAFEVSSRTSANVMIALVCDKSLSPRITTVASYRAMKNQNMVRVLEGAIVYWPPAGRQVFVIIMERPPLKKMMSPNDPKPLDIKEDRIVQSLIRPMLMLLSDFRSVDMIHGGIVPENIFFAGGEGSETAVLGEGLSSATFFRHHAFYETIERGMAQPSGRGLGTIKNDLYSLGMCVIIAARGINIPLGKPVDQIIREKLEMGSISFAGTEKLPDGVSEFLRGVLNDDERQRWDLDDALLWLEGRHPGNKQNAMTVKAQRPFIFREEKYWDMRTIAMSFFAHVTEGAEVAQRDQFDLWIKRNFDDKKLHERFSKALSYDDAAGVNKRLANIIMALDPQGPVRYKGLSLMPQGFGVALGDAMAREQEVQIYAEILTHQFFSVWLNQLFDDTPDAGGMLAAFDKCRNYLVQKMLGYGIERVVYTLNKEIACLSPAFKKFFVISPGHLLLALEALSYSPQRPEALLDRHMTAFISVRDAKLIDPYLGQLVSRERHVQVIGVLRVLAGLQRRFRVPAVPGVGAWVISILPPVIEKFNDLDMRQSISKKLSTLPNPGILQTILDVIDAPGLAQDDLQRYNGARQEYAMLVREGKIMAANLKQRRTFGADVGRQVAMLFSTFLAVFSAISFLVVHYVFGMR